jgi:hypothetical protein
VDHVSLIFTSCYRYHRASRVRVWATFRDAGRWQWWRARLRCGGRLLLPRMLPCARQRLRVPRVLPPPSLRFTHGRRRRVDLPPWVGCPSPPCLDLPSSTHHGPDPPILFIVLCYVIGIREEKRCSEKNCHCNFIVLCIGTLRHKDEAHCL